MKRQFCTNRKKSLRTSSTLPINERSLSMSYLHVSTHGDSLSRAHWRSLWNSKLTTASILDHTSGIQCKSNLAKSTRTSSTLVSTDSVHNTMTEYAQPFGGSSANPLRTISGIRKFGKKLQRFPLTSSVQYKLNNNFCCKKKRNNSFIATPWITSTLLTTSRMPHLVSRESSGTPNSLLLIGKGGLAKHAMSRAPGGSPSLSALALPISMQAGKLITTALSTESSGVRSSHPNCVEGGFTLAEKSMKSTEKLLKPLSRSRGGFLVSKATEDDFSTTETGKKKTNSSPFVAGNIASQASTSGRTIVITSGKGGVGKTTATANLGMSIARLGYRVALIDADIGLRNLDLLLGLENRVLYTAMDILEGQCRLDQALIRDKRWKNLSLLSISKNRQRYNVTRKNMERLVASVSALGYHFVIIDCPAGIDVGFINAISPAQEALVVTTPEITAIRDADRVAGLLEANGVYDVKLLVNRVRPEMIQKNDMMSVRDVQEMLGIPLLGGIPEDSHVIVSTNRGEPLVLKRKLTLSGIAFENAARRLIGKQDYFIDLKSPYKGIFHKMQHILFG